ncbi:MAG: SDR family oxidoreductase [Paracoccaceae bacterium]|nr:SDR family oxidoreductase [Paracoccaceae bacterium]
MNNKIKSVFVTGGAGYCGSLLVPKLLQLGFKVTVYDLLLFGCNHLPIGHENLKLISGDIRDIKLLSKALVSHDAFLNLACISNDASFEIDEDVSTSINMNAFEPMVNAAKEAGIKRFIYASSSSVYGVSDAKNVKEDHPLVPLTLYNKYKGMCEPILNNFGSENFTVTTFRPATVCGYAPRLRLDLSVNILTNHAITNNEIKVFGGDQLRPNLDVRDYINVCIILLNAPHELIHKNVFNVGYQNMKIKDIAKLVKKVVLEQFLDKNEIKIVTTPSDDLRSYHINSDKIKNILNFQPKYSIEDAVRSLCLAFKKGKISNSMENEIYYNIRTMKSLGIK